MALWEETLEREVAALVGFYERAQARLERVLVAATTTPFGSRRAELLVEQIESILAALKAQQRGWARQALPLAYRQGMLLAAQGLQLPVLPAMTLIARESVEVALQRMLVDTEQALDSVAPFARRVWIDTQQRVLAEPKLAELVAQGRLEGLGPRELGRRLRQTMRDGALSRLEGQVSPELAARLQRVARGQFIDILCRDGITRSYRLQEYAELVAQATTRMVATEGTLRQTVAFGGDLVQLSVHANPCPALCLPVQGTIYSISGQNPDFPMLRDEVRPPLHPHCKHVLTPVSEWMLRSRGLYEVLSEFSRDETRTLADGAAYAELLRPAREAAQSARQALAEAL